MSAPARTLVEDERGNAQADQYPTLPNGAPHEDRSEHVLIHEPVRAPRRTYVLSTPGPRMIYTSPRAPASESRSPRGHARRTEERRRGRSPGNLLVEQVRDEHLGEQIASAAAVSRHRTSTFGERRR